ncbi:MAG: biotin carboxylase N-terminal domain-containing protein [Gammaproteobacteria bacterium]
MFQKLLIANRGEIACRVARTAKRLGVGVAAVYSEADARALHVRVADEAWPIGPGPAAQSYLNIEKILEAARKAGADAIHPGYGFLSENPTFAAACQDAGIAFVGPPAAAMLAMASKSAAKERMSKAGVPVLPGYHGDEQSTAALERRAKELGFPLIIKPSGGGGGKGMRIVTEAGGLREAIEGAKRVAAAAFKDDRLLLERYLPAPRHVEVQVFADRHGSIVHLFDRDCSVQRRHQKLIEEAPAPGLDDAVRSGLYAAACTVAREVGYVGAGTIEFLLNGRDFHFMEMNTRLQVEHPVTEGITGLDLVEWQLRVAAGEPLPLKQADIHRAGHAIEVRLCAEDPSRDFVPSVGTLDLLWWPTESDGLRVDRGFESGDAVPAFYDSLLGKIIAHGPSRDAALDRLIAGVEDVRADGVATNASWLARALRAPAFRQADVSTAFIPRNSALLGANPDPTPAAALAGASRVWQLAPWQARPSPWDVMDGFRLGRASTLRIPLVLGERHLDVEVLESTPERSVARVDGKTFELSFHDSFSPLLQWVEWGGASADVLVHPHRIDVWRLGEKVSFTLNDGSQFESATAAHAGGLVTPLPGVVVSVAVKEGDTVTAGQTLLVIEAMKMEHAIKAPRAGTVKSLKHKAGDRVREGSALAEIE